MLLATLLPPARDEGRARAVSARAAGRATGAARVGASSPAPSAGLDIGTGLVAGALILGVVLYSAANSRGG